MSPTSGRVERQTMDVDIVCVGFGPADGAVSSTTLVAAAASNPDGTPAIESPAMPGLPLQVICYERADDIGFGVSGVVTRARGIRASLPGSRSGADSDGGAGQRGEGRLPARSASAPAAGPRALRAATRMLRARWASPIDTTPSSCPYIPPFLHKHDGLVLSLGPVHASGSAQQLMATGRGADLAGDARGRAAHRGRPRRRRAPGRPGRGQAGQARRRLHARHGRARGADRGRRRSGRRGRPRSSTSTSACRTGTTSDEWAVGMKMVVDLPEDVDLEPGTVFHTFGYPEPEIFGFLYVHPGPRRRRSGIFVPVLVRQPGAHRVPLPAALHAAPVPLALPRRAARCGRWGAKSLQESGRRGEPFLAGDGYARIGEGSGSTNVLTGSGVDEAWTTGVQLAEGVLELLRGGQAVHAGENLERTYVARRRDELGGDGRRASPRRRATASTAASSPGLLGHGARGLDRRPPALCAGAAAAARARRRSRSTIAGRIPPAEIDAASATDCARAASPLHDALMDRVGWPAIPFDGQLLVSHQDALLMGGKVQAPAGYADHVVFRRPATCASAAARRLCVEMCSGQAHHAAATDGVPGLRPREVRPLRRLPVELPRARRRQTTSSFRAGAGGLHSAEN